MVIHGDLTQAIAVIDVVIHPVAVGAAGTHTVLVIGELPEEAYNRHGSKFPAMLPCKYGIPVAEHITYFIVGDIIAVPIGQQIAPCAVAVGVVTADSGRTQRPCLVEWSGPEVGACEAFLHR